MKKALLVIGLVLVLGGVAEASQFSSGLSKTWGYLFTPVNCVAQLGADVVAALVKTFQCIVTNANPGNLIP